MGNVQELRQALLAGSQKDEWGSLNRHTAIAVYINNMGYLKALDTEEKRFALSGDGLFKK
jgi:hypothetical protein